MKERLAVQDGRKVARGGAKVEQTLVSSKVENKVDTSTASNLGRHQKEVRNSLGWAERHNMLS